MAGRSPWVSRPLVLHGAGLALGLALLVLVTQASWPSLPSRLGELAVLVLLVATHLHLVVRTWHGTPSRGDLPTILVGVAAGASLLTLAPRFSSDVTAYVIYGRMSAIYGSNPALTSPMDVADDSAFEFLDSAHKASVSVYGPVWTVTSQGVTGVAEALGGGYETYLVLYYVVALAAALVSVWAVWRLLARWKPERQLGGTLLYAWSPLLLIEVSSAHNDLLMLAVMGLGLLLLSRDRVLLGFALLTAAALVKWIAVVVLVVMGAASIASATGPAARTSRALRLGGLVLAMAALAYVVVGDPWRALPAPFTGAAGIPVNSLAEIVAELGVRLDEFLGFGIGADAVQSGVTIAGALLMVAALVVGAVVAYRHGSVRAAVDPAVVTLLVTCVVAPRLWPWYALWPLVLAPLARRQVAVVAGLFASSTLLLYPLLPGAEEMPLLTAPRAIVATAPVLVATGWCVARGRHPARPASSPPARAQRVGGQRD